MIFVAAGTKDGREIVTMLCKKGYSVIASVVSQYGKELLQGIGNLVINSEPLDEKNMQEYMRTHKITLCIDASHPYAANVSANAIAACHALQIPYLRYERDLSTLGDSVHIANSYEDAAKQAASLGQTVFLTTGSRNLDKFVHAPEIKAKCTKIIARVLPTAKVLALCESLCLLPSQIVAMQGPFSEALNAELFLRYHTDVVVTKNSGSIGGTDTKLAAARRLGIPVIVIDRPPMSYDNIAHTYEAVLRFVEGEEQQ